MSKRHLYRPPLSVALETNCGIGCDGGIVIFVQDADNVVLSTLNLSAEGFDKFIAGYLRKRGVRAFVVKEEYAEDNND